MTIFILCYLQIRVLHRDRKFPSLTYPGAREPGAVGGGGGSLSPQLWSRGAVPPPQLFIWLGAVGAVVLPKLGVVGHKGKLNEKKK